MEGGCGGGVVGGVVLNGYTCITGYLYLVVLNQAPLTCHKPPTMGFKMVEAGLPYP